MSEEKRLQYYTNIINKAPYVEEDEDGYLTFYTEEGRKFSRRIKIGGNAYQFITKHFDLGFTTTTTKPTRTVPDVIEIDIKLSDDIGAFKTFDVDTNAVNLATLLESIKMGFRDMLRRRLLVSNIILFFITDDNKILFRTIKPSKIHNYQDFSDRIDEIIRGDSGKPGSDTINEDLYELNYSSYRLLTVKSGVGAGGGFTHQIYKHIKIGNKYKSCALNCLDYFKYDVSEMADEPVNYNSMKQICEDNKIPFKFNDFSPNALFYDEYFNYFEGEPTMFDNGGEIEPFYKVKNNHIKQTKDGGICICYAHDNQHYAIVDTRYTNLYVNMNNIFAVWDGTGKPKFINPKQLINDFNRPSDNAPVAVDERYLFIDLETVIDWSCKSKMVPYSVAVYITDAFGLRLLEERANDVKEVKEVIDRMICFTGADCMDQFYEYFMEIQKHKRFNIITFNGSNFDNLILADYFMTKNADIVSDFMYTKSSLLNFKISGRHDFFDVAKHLVGRLSTLCMSFKVGLLSKKTFDHFEMQMRYDENPEQFFKDVNNDSELIEYNKYDVAALAVLLQKYYLALTTHEVSECSTKRIYDIPCVADLIKEDLRYLMKYKTVNSLIYSAFIAEWEANGVEIPKFYNDKKKTSDKLFEMYKDCMKFKVAGRCELFNGVSLINERVASVDVCSMYPYQMAVAPNYYPTGELKIITKETEKFLKNKIGFYYCDIDQSHLINNNIPLIYPEKTSFENDWGTTKILENYLISSVIKDALIKYGCKVVVKGGFYFTDKIKGCDLFPAILQLMKIKNAQDILKIEGNKNYNPALRETMKLLSNAPSGKMIESLHIDKISVIGSSSEYFKLMDKKNISNLSIINILGNKVACQYELDEKTLIKKHRPIYWSCLIYDYSKMYLYDHVISKIPREHIHYTDTDSVKITYTAFEKWRDEYASKTIVPHFQDVEAYDERYINHTLYMSGSKVYGSFEDEYEPIKVDGETCYNNWNFFMAKKMYTSIYRKNGKYHLIKDRFKGAKRNDLLINTDSEYNGKKLFTVKTNGDIVINLTDEELFYYYHTNTHLSIIGANYKNFLIRLQRDKQVYIMCSQFKKDFKNLKKAVSLDELERQNIYFNSIKSHITIKKITI